MIEAHFSAAIRQRDCVFAVCDLDGRIDGIVDALDVRGEREHVGDLLADIAQPARDLGEHKPHGDDGAEVHAAARQRKRERNAVDE